MRLAWLFSALVLSALLATLQFQALEHLWYWEFPWFDTLMHFIGGLAVGTFGVAFLGSWRPWLFLAGMVGIALGWELFELVINAEREANFAFDTALDILMDAVGMSVAYVLARFTIWRYA